MATAIAKTATKTVDKTVSEKVVKLELTEDEAKFIYSITGKIGGCPDTSYRRLSDSIRRAIGNLGYRTDSADYFNVISSMRARTIE